MVKKTKIGRPRILKKRGKPKNTDDLFKLNADLTQEQFSKIKWLAEQNEQSVSKTIRDIIDLFPPEKNLITTRRKYIIKEYFDNIVIRNRNKKSEEQEDKE